ncbi:DUF2550 family protein [Ornithinimicrobium cavernae]|uniref:DUF2550 family protein n=1 Tax=Ornithinimicrobium cavernae TaxID=2666047 RepID=UPI000D691016|nr:DUF2550 family protein [Ornithinimicrobium cavernae]
MDTGGILLIVLAMLAAVLLMAVGFVLFTRFGAGSHAFPCAYRADESSDWSRGQLTYDSGRLDHYGRGGPFRDPLHRWQRSGLELGIARAQDPADVPWLSGHVLAVPCAYADDRFELALGLEHYTALRSWLESVPPGWNANVA